MLRIQPRLVSIIHAANPLIQQSLPRRRTLVAQSLGQSVNRQHGQTIPITLVANRQLQRSIDIALLLVPSDVHVLLSGAVVGQTVDEPGVRVEVEDNGLVGCEEGRVFRVFEAMRVVTVLDQFEEVDDVDEADLEFGEMVAEKCGCCQRFLRRDITTARHDEVGFLAGIVGSPLPDTNTLCAMSDGVFHVEELEVICGG